MKQFIFTCTLLVFFAALSACGHRVGGTAPHSGSAGDIPLEGSPRFNGSGGTIGVTTIRGQDDNFNYTMVVSFGDAPLGTVSSDIRAYHVSNGLRF